MSHVCESPPMNAQGISSQLICVAEEIAPTWDPFLVLRVDLQSRAKAFAILDGTSEFVGGGTRQLAASALLPSASSGSNGEQIGTANWRRRSLSKLGHLRVRAAASVLISTSLIPCAPSFGVPQFLEKASSLRVGSDPWPSGKISVAIPVCLW